MSELGLTQLFDYRAYLERHDDEWEVLDRLSRISISRFYRDRDVFEHLRDEVLPELARTARCRSGKCFRIWSAGCASGEEPYTVAILWHRHVQPAFSDVNLRLLATDADEYMLQRARQASYPASSLKDAPADWRQKVFTRSDREYTLRPEFRELVEFRQQDIRAEIPTESFHLILCRNLVFTYFAEAVQRQVLERIVTRLVPGGLLVLGKHERLPEGTRSFCTAAAVSKSIVRFKPATCP